MPATHRRATLDLVKRLGRSVIVLVAAISTAAGCSSDDEGEGEGDISSDTVSDTVAVDPSDTANDDLLAFTPTIRITESGYLPQQAVAVFGENLTFVNETEREQLIEFMNGTPHIGGPDTIGPIEPGGTVTVEKPLDTAVSLIFESEGLPGFTGRLQIDPGVDDL